MVVLFRFDHFYRNFITIIFALPVAKKIDEISSVAG